MHISWIAAAAGLAVVTAGCRGGSSAPAPVAAPSETAAVAAVTRFAAREHVQRVVAVGCDAARRDGSRVCTATLARTCDSYAVRFDRRHRVRIAHAQATCYWLDLEGTVAATPIG